MIRSISRSLVLTLAAVALCAAAATAQALNPQQQLARDIYQELIEINTVTATGDTLRAESEVLEKTASKSRPDMGSYRGRTTVFNQHDEPVMRLISIGLIRRRPAG